MRRISAIALVIGTILSASCDRNAASSADDEYPVATLNQCSVTSGVKATVIAANLDVPWDLDFAPDGRIFLTELSGHIRVVENGTVKQQPWISLPVETNGVGGLSGIAVSPNFEQDGFIYVAGTFSRIGDSWLSQQYFRAARLLGRILHNDSRFSTVTRILRIRDKDGKGVEPKVIIDDIPGDAWHGTSAIEFGPDGMLYISTGYASVDDTAQDPASLAGKILRYSPSGEIPIDNPDPDSPVYALGMRHSQGLAWHPWTGSLIATDHGSDGRDELDVIRPNGNYGWPIVSGPGHHDRFSQPLVTWEETVAPSGIAAIDRPGAPLDGNLLVGTLKGQQLLRISLERSHNGNDLRATCQEPILYREFGRIRAVKIGPDSGIYITTSNRGFNGKPTPGDDRLIRLEFL